MANNRMYLICGRCCIDEDKTLEESILYLAKYYPQGGWPPLHTTLESMNIFMKQHSHATLLGQEIRIAYEGELFDDAHGKQEILKAVQNGMANTVRNIT